LEVAANILELRWLSRYSDEVGRFQAEATDFYFLHSVQIGSGAHTVIYPKDTRGGSLPGGRAAGS
jgi:hypothetical protein